MKPAWRAVFVVAAIAILRIAEIKSDEPGKVPTGADAMTGKKAGEVRDDNILKMKLVWCSPGSVRMETVEFTTESASEKEVKPNDDDDFDPKDQPAPTPRQARKVTPVKAFVTRGYWIGKYEVTQLEWSHEMESE